MYSGAFLLLFTPSTHFYLPLFPAGIKPSTPSSLRTSVASMLPWGLQGFSCLKSAVYTGTVWKQHRAPETPPPPLPPAFMPLNQSSPPTPSFSLDSAFASFLFVAPSLPGSLVSDRPAVCRCVLLFMCRGTDECTCRCQRQHLIILLKSFPCTQGERRHLAM